MKVFVLGGYGKTGIEAIKLLAKSDLITEIAIVGRNLERAEKTALEIGKKANAVQADGMDRENLIRASQGYDIILNAASNEAMVPSIQAAIRNRIHYCDVSWGEILDQALQLAPEARAAGITAVIANGVSPCISNLMAVYAARYLDEVKQFQIGRAEFFNFENGKELTPKQWKSDPKKSLQELSEFKPFVTWMFQRIQENGIRSVLDYQDNQWVEVNPVQKGMGIPLVEIDTALSFPYGSGDDFFGTLPKDVAETPPVEIWFTPFPPTAHTLLREQATRVLEENIDHKDAINTFYEMISNNPDELLILPDDFVFNTKMWVRALGKKDGRAARSTCWFTTRLWNTGGYFLTSVALVTAALMVLRGEIEERGVFTAEKAFDPQAFFSEVVTLLPEIPPSEKIIDETFEWLEQI